MLQGETMSIMFADGAEAPSANIMDMVSPYAPGFALWKHGVQDQQQLPYTHPHRRCGVSTAFRVAENRQLAHLFMVIVATFFLLTLPYAAFKLLVTYWQVGLKRFSFVA